MKQNLVPLKIVVEKLGLSRASLWRAARSGIADFPRPTIIRRRVYWSARELKALEAALDRYEGRCKFEAERDHARTTAALKAKRASVAKRPRRRSPRKAEDPQQQDLF